MSIADKLTTIAENEQKVYDAGAKSEYDRFWDNYQDNGNRTIYSYAFAGRGWTAENFKPKYSFSTDNGAYTFYDTRMAIDLAQCCIDNNVEIDFSNATSMQRTFGYSYFTRLPRICVKNATDLNMTFYYMDRLVRIDSLVLNNEGTTKFLSTFVNCTRLQNLTIEGVIGQNIDLSSSTELTHDSLMSVIDALKDYSGGNETHTATLGAANLAKLTDAEKAVATQKGWSLA